MVNDELQYDYDDRFDDAGDDEQCEYCGAVNGHDTDCVCMARYDIDSDAD